MLRDIARRGRWAFVILAALVLLVLPAIAEARRSGGSFGGRSGFRSGGGFRSPQSAPAGGYRNNRYGGGGGPSFFFFPGFGWGGYGMGGGGGFGLLGTLMIAGVLGLAVVSVVRAVKQHRQAARDGYGDGDYGDEPAVMPGRAYVYKLQLGLGRSARGIQQRLEQFAASGDTGTEAGLATLLQQTALELLREKDSVRYAGGESSGPMNLGNAEHKLNGLTIAERSQFQVERVRAVDGRVNRSQAPAEEGTEVLEYVVVTLLVVTRTPLSGWQPITSPGDLGVVLSGLGGVSPDGMLGMEVIWSPADSNDSLTGTDLMTSYPDLKSL